MKKFFQWIFIPMQLLKAILAQDIDLMENLGIYEVAEEDFALVRIYLILPKSRSSPLSDRDWI